MNLIPLLSGFPKNYTYLINIVPSEYVAVVLLETNDTSTLVILNQQRETIYKKRKIHMLFKNFKLIQEHYPTVKKSNLNIESFYGFYSLEPDNLDAFSIICVIKDKKTLKYYTIQSNFSNFNTQHSNVIISESFGNYNKPLNVYTKSVKIYTEFYQERLDNDLIFSYILTSTPDSYGNRLIKAQKYAYSSQITELIKNNILPPTTSTLFPILKEWESPFTISYTPPDVENTKMEFSTGMMLLQYHDETILPSAQSLVLPSFPDTLLFALNLAPLNNTDANLGIYMASCGNSPRWGGCNIYNVYLDDDGNDIESPIICTSFSDANESIGGVIKNTTNVDIYGNIITSTYLKDGSYYTFDNNNTITISLFKQTHLGAILTSCTESEILNNRLKNLCLIGSELIQFKTAEKIDDRTYKISNFLRGRKNTEHHINTHTSNENFLFISEDSNIFRRIVAEIPTDNTSIFNISDLNKNFSIKKQTIVGEYVQPLASLQSTPYTLTFGGIRPYSPCHANYSVSLNKDVNITWCRRARINSNWVNNNGVALDEVFEKYEIDVRLQNSDLVIRTISSECCSVTYTAAQQFIDTNTTGLDFVFDIYQLSSYDENVTIRGEKTSLEFSKGNTVYVPPISVITMMSDETVMFQVDDRLVNINSTTVKINIATTLEIPIRILRVYSRNLTLNWLEDYNHGRYHNLPTCINSIVRYPLYLTLTRKRVLSPRNCVSNFKSDKIPPLRIKGTFRNFPTYICHTTSSHISLSINLYCPSEPCDKISTISTTIRSEDIYVRPCLHCFASSSITHTRVPIIAKIRLVAVKCSMSIKSTKPVLRITHQHIYVPTKYSIYPYVATAIPIRIRYKIYTPLKYYISTNSTVLEFLNQRLISLVRFLRTSGTSYLKFFVRYRITPNIFSVRLSRQPLMVRIIKQSIKLPTTYKIGITSIYARIQKHQTLASCININRVIGISNTVPKLFERIVPQSSMFNIIFNNVSKFAFNYRLIIPKTFKSVLVSTSPKLSGRLRLSIPQLKISTNGTSFVQTHISIDSVDNSSFQIKYPSTFSLQGTIDADLSPINFVHIPDIAFYNIKYKLKTPSTYSCHITRSSFALFGRKTTLTATGGVCKRVLSTIATVGRKIPLSNIAVYSRNINSTSNIILTENLYTTPYNFYYSSTTINFGIKYKLTVQNGIKTTSHVNVSLDARYNIGLIDGILNNILSTSPCVYRPYKIVYTTDMDGISYHNTNPENIDLLHWYVLYYPPQSTSSVSNCNVDNVGITVNYNLSVYPSHHSTIDYPSQMCINVKYRLTPIPYTIITNSTSYQNFKICFATTLSFIDNLYSISIISPETDNIKLKLSDVLRVSNGSSLITNYTAGNIALTTINIFAYYNISPVNSVISHNSSVYIFIRCLLELFNYNINIKHDETVCLLDNITIDRMNYSNDADAKVAYVSSINTYIDDVMPVMTAATTSGVTVSALVYNFNDGFPWYAFDALGATCWISTNGAAGTFPVWIKVDLGSTPKYIEQFYFIANDPIDTPKAFTFQGSNDNSNWTTLYTEPSYTTNNTYTSTDANFSNKAVYRYYRLYITSAKIATYVYIGDMKLREKALQVLTSTSSTDMSYSLNAKIGTSCSISEKITRTFSPNISLANMPQIVFKIKALRTGSNFKLRITNSDNITYDYTPNILVSDTWQICKWNIYTIPNRAKTSITKLEIIPITTTTFNDVFIDNMYKGAIDDGYLTINDSYSCSVISDNISLNYINILARKDYTQATGGTIDTTTIPNVVIHKFTTTTQFNPTYPRDINVLLVGGGGGGSFGIAGTTYGSGGGGGLILYTTSNILSTTTITIGTGGFGGTLASINGTDGGDTIFNSMVATGGHGAIATSRTGGSNHLYTGGTGTGGTYSSGGGGAGAGGNGVGGAGPTNGGIGIYSTITGSSVGYGGGGGGGSGNISFRGIGTCGGGTGGDYNTRNGEHGIANTGGGGGGAAYNSSGYYGGNGGTGYAVIAYSTLSCRKYDYITNTSTTPKLHYSLIARSYSISTISTTSLNINITAILNLNTETLNNHTTSSTSPDIELVDQGIIVLDIIAFYNDKSTNTWEISSSNIDIALVVDLIVFTPESVIGGDSIYQNGDKNVHMFTTIGTSTFTTPYPILAEILVIAGGGGGGGGYYTDLGGGGAGGLVYHSRKYLTEQSFNVIVGNGGLQSTNGEDSIFDNITAIGGGAGKYSQGYGDGGSGGGCGISGIMSGGVATQTDSGGGIGYGHCGGVSGGNMAYGGGGGGAGDDGNTNGYAYGGDGLEFSITGTPTYYAGGGGGAGSGDWDIFANGGNGGGGGGSRNWNVGGNNGTVNTGGGGGAGWNYSGGSGGSGVIIVSYNMVQSDFINPISDQAIIQFIKTSLNIDSNNISAISDNVVIVSQSDIVIVSFKETWSVVNDSYDQSAP